MTKSKAITPVKKHVLKKNVSVIHISAKLSLIQRKLVNALLYNAYDTLLTSDTHSINVSLLSEMIGFDSHNVGYLKDALKGMVETSVEWDVLEDDGVQSWEVSSLLSFARIRSGECTYRYDKGLAEKLYHPDIYSKINLSVVKHMKSAYALILYENCHRFVTTGQTGWWTLETFRKMMGLENDSIYAQFKFLNRDIIKPAVAEVNKLSNIHLEFETKRKGRTISGINFSVKHNPQLSLLEMEEGDEVTESDVFKQLLKMKVAKPLARAWIAEYGDEYILDKIEYVRSQASAGRIKASKGGFLKAAVENNYVSEKEATKESRKVAEDKKARREALERTVDARESFWRQIERKFRSQNVQRIETAFSDLSVATQEELLVTFVEDLSPVQINDFKKNQWKSIIAYKAALEFWAKRSLPFPSFEDFAVENGIENPASYQKENAVLREKLENR